MIEYRKGNLLNVTSGVIAHGVNCQGVMGSGVAKAIREKYPHVFDAYLKDVNSWKEGFGSTKGQLGRVQFISSVYTKGTRIFNEAPLVIANCFTQNEFGTLRRQVDYEAVAQCFATLNTRSKLYGQLNIPKLYGQLNIPKIGAGLGGGDWNVIESIIKSEYKDDVIVWEL